MGKERDAVTYIFEDVPKRGAHLQVVVNDDYMAGPR
jgi:hypothetical protein